MVMEHVLGETEREKAREYSFWGPNQFRYNFKNIIALLFWKFELTGNSRENIPSRKMQSDTAKWSSFSMYSSQPESRDSRATAVPVLHFNFYAIFLRSFLEVISLFTFSLLLFFSSFFAFLMEFLSFTVGEFRFFFICWFGWILGVCFLWFFSILFGVYPFPAGSCYWFSFSGWMNLSWF